jgi:hypothetical protein
MTTEQFDTEISTVGAAEKYKLTPSYIARLARNRIIRARKFGRDWIVDEQGLQDYLAQPRRPGPKPRMMDNHVEQNNIQIPREVKSERDHHAAKEDGAGEDISQ